MTKKAAAPKTTATLEACFAGSPRHLASLAALRKMESVHSLLLELAHDRTCADPRTALVELKSALGGASHITQVEELRALETKAREVAHLAVRNFAMHYKVNG